MSSRRRADAPVAATFHFGCFLRVDPDELALMFQSLRFRVSIFSFFLCVLVAVSSADDVTRYGAVLIRAELGRVDDQGLLLPSEPLPQIFFSENDASTGWKIVHGEAFTGVDARRFYMTVEAQGKDLPAPEIVVTWENVKISRAIGASDFETIDGGGARFKPNASAPPTGSFTEVVFGAAHLGVFHNWKIRRCGPYRDGRYPQTQIDAHLNYMLAFLEVCRAYGWTDTSDPDFVDHINIYGFETLFPNGHRDFPAHFHIMLAWDGWSAAQVGHYLLDENGLIEKNSFWSLHKDVERFDLPGVVTPYRDKTDRLTFTTEILPDGSGLIISRPDDKVEFLMRAGRNGATKSVEVCKRPIGVANDSGWNRICDVIANDDVEKGAFRSVARYESGVERVVEFNYDPDTGRLLTDH